MNTKYQIVPYLRAVWEKSSNMEHHHKTDGNIYTLYTEKHSSGLQGDSGIKAEKSENQELWLLLKNIFLCVINSWSKYPFFKQLLYHL